METTEPTYQLVSLTIDNIMRLSAVHIDFDGHPVVVIGGENAAGKSSVLKAIEMVLGGMDVACKEPVRHGAGWARVVADLGDIVATRKWVEGRERESVLEVRSKAGARFSSPQTLLSSLLGRLGFDPLEFEKKDAREPKKQERILRELAGIKTDDIEKAYDKTFEERTAVNRSVKTMEAQLAGYHRYPEAPAEEVSIADLTRELEAANDTVRALDKAREAHGLVSKDLKAAQELVVVSLKVQDSLGVRRQEAERQLATIISQIESEQENLQALRRGVETAEAKVGLAVDSGLEIKKLIIDAAPIKAKIEAAEGVNRQVRANETYNGLKQALEDEQATAQRLTDELDALTKEKAARLAAAKFPIAGLAIDERGVIFNSVPFDQASQAERIRVAVAISAALNPKLRLVLIREGSLLDRKSMKLLEELAVEYRLQVIVEKVAESKDGVTVLITDGHIAENGAVAVDKPACQCNWDSPSYPPTEDEKRKCAAWGTDAAHQPDDPFADPPTASHKVQSDPRQPVEDPFPAAVASKFKRGQKKTQEAA